MKRLAIFIFLFSINSQHVNCQQEHNFSDTLVYNRIIEQPLGVTITRMEEAAKTNTAYQPLVEKAKKVAKITKDYYDYIDEIRTRMGMESGGFYTEEEAVAEGKPELAGRPRGKKDTDTPQRIFVSGDYGAQGKKDPIGPIIDKKIQELRKNYILLVEQLWDNGGIEGTVFADLSKKDVTIQELEKEIMLTSSENYQPANHENKSWAEFTFGHMPVAAVYPMLRKFQNDARSSEGAIVNFLVSQMGKLHIVYDNFDVLMQSSKPSVILGQTYEAEISLGTYASQIPFSVFVDGRYLPVVNGKAKYTVTGSSVGEKTYSAKISVQNPLTGEVESFTKNFHYEVGQPSVNVSLDKMNVIYAGVDNPVTAACFPNSNFIVTMIGGTLTKYGKNSYVGTADKPGNAVITVKDTLNGKNFPFHFRVKRIPDPIVRLGKETDGLIDTFTFKSQQGLLAWLDDFDFDARCLVQSYTLYYTPKGKEMVEFMGVGSRWTSEIAEVIGAAKPGDQYVFTNVKTKCSGDTVDRRVNSLAFIIK